MKTEAKTRDGESLKEPPGIFYEPASLLKWLWLCSAAGAFLLSCEDAMVEPEIYSSIMGIVLEDSSGAAIQGASITTNPATEALVTDGDGKFTIEDIPVGDYTISARKQGYSRTSVSVAVRKDRAIQATLLMAEEETGDGSANIAVTNWWNSIRNGEVFVEVEYRITNTGTVDIAEFDVSFRIQNAQGDFFHNETGNELQAGRSKSGQFEKHVRQEEASQVVVEDVWTRLADQ